MVEAMGALTKRLAADINDLAAGDSSQVRRLTSRPLGEVLRSTADAQTAGVRSLAKAADDIGGSEEGRASLEIPAFTRLPEPEQVRLHSDNWRSYLGRKKYKWDAERRHDNNVYNTRYLLRRSGLSDDLAHPAVPGTPEFDRMLAAADSDLFIYIVRSDGSPVIVPERIDNSRLNHDGLILHADDTVTAAGEVRITGNAGNYIVPDLNNRSGGFAPAAGTLSGSALPAFEQYGLFPQQITVHKPGESIVYPRGG
ncbi:MAG: hypothetical protein HOQ44_12695 [Nocardia sp.]|nr:hypothetical protein [Nocardia sp.]